MSRPDEQPTLGERSFRAVLWTLGAQSSVFVSQLITMAVLGRLLDPAEMGLVALTMVFLNLAVLAGGAGLSRALVQRERVTPIEEGAALWASLGWASAMWAIYAVAAAPLAEFFSDARLGPVIVASGAMALPAAVWPLAAARLERELRFREVGLAELMGFAVTQAAVTIVAAVGGAGIWSPVLGALAGRIVQTVWLAAWSGWRPRACFSWAATASLARFGLWTTGAGLAVFLTSSVDYLIAGRLLGPAALGLYAVAYQLATLPRARMVAAVALVAFPSLSRIQSDPARLGRAWLRMNAWVGFAVFPVLAAMFVLAEPVVGVLFGERWVGAAPALRILCPAGALMAVRATAGSAVNAAGRPALGFASNLFVLAAAVPILSWTAPHGIEALSYGVLAVSVIDFLPLQLVVARRLSVNGGDLAWALGRPAALALAAAAIVSLAVRALDQPLVTLVAGGSLFLALYAALVLTFAPAILGDARRMGTDLFSSRWPGGPVHSASRK